jgi:hypothetical protein
MKTTTIGTLSIMLLAPFATAAQAQAAQGQADHDTPGGSRYHAAQYDANTHEVTFDQFAEINWEAKARAALAWLNFDHTTPKQIARLHDEIAGPEYRSVDFDAPLDPTIEPRPVPSDLRNRSRPHRASPA